MTTKTEIFVALHLRGNFLVIFNIRDAGSAVAVAKAAAMEWLEGQARVALESVDN
jgi:hypothetical protein